MLSPNHRTERVPSFLFLVVFRFLKHTSEDKSKGDPAPHTTPHPEGDQNKERKGMKTCQCQVKESKNLTNLFGWSRIS